MKAFVLCSLACKKFPGSQTRLRAQLNLLRDRGLFSCGKTELQWQRFWRKCFKTMSCFTISRWLKSPSFPRSSLGEGEMCGLKRGECEWRSGCFWRWALGYAGWGSGQLHQGKTLKQKMSSRGKFRWLPQPSYALSSFIGVLIQGFSVGLFLL